MNSRYCGLKIPGLTKLGDSRVKTFAWMSVAAAALAIFGCNIDGKSSVGGTLTGLMGQGLVLEDNSGNSLSLSSNGEFVFSGSIGNGDAYSVTVATQPSNPAQTCTVHNGSGTIDKANIVNVLVSCTQPGRFAYVDNQGSNDLSAYLINPSTGLLTPIAGSPFASQGTTPVSLTVDPNGLFLYVVDNASNDVSVYSIDNSTGQLAPAGVPIATGTGPLALAVDPTDTFLFVANFGSNSVSAYTIDSTTGLLTELNGSPLSVGSEPA